MKQLTLEDLALSELDAESVAIINGWLARGDGVALYQNADFNSVNMGHRQYVSFGSSEAQLETDEPPTTLPDIGGHINWRYQLVGVYRPSKEAS